MTAAIRLNSRTINRNSEANIDYLFEKIPKSLCSKFQSTELIFEEDIEIFEKVMQFAMFIELRIDVKRIKILKFFLPS